MGSGGRGKWDAAGSGRGFGLCGVAGCEFVLILGFQAVFCPASFFFPAIPLPLQPSERSTGPLAEGPSLAVHRGWVIFGRNTYPVHKIKYYVSSC
jgi:hypothetical protein